MRDSSAWIRMAVLMVALLNQLLQSAGYGVLPISEACLQELASWLLTTGAALWVWLKR